MANFPLSPTYSPTPGIQGKHKLPLKHITPPYSTDVTAEIAAAVLIETDRAETAEVAAIATAEAASIPITYLTTDVTLGANSDVLVPSEKAIKTYVDAAIIAGAGEFVWNQVTTSQVMLVKNGYVTNNSSVVTLTLPPTSVFGDLIEVAGKGAGGWAIVQNAGQQIHAGNLNTTLGVGGSLSSTLTFDNVKLLCITDNTDWEVINIEGNITVV
jgi:hypothetical protein